MAKNFSSKKVQLIRAPLDSWYNVGQFDDLVSAPIGLCLVARSLADKHRVSVIDGLKLDIEKVLKGINANIVGVTDIYSSHSNALKILEEAKKRGATTFIGGPNVSFLARQILQNRPFVDFAVLGDGEGVLDLFLDGKSPEEIPNLAYRKKEEIIINPRKDIQLNQLFDLEQVVHLEFDKGKPFPISSIRGCIKAEESERCSFCALEHKLKLMDPELVWQQIRLLYERYGLRYFFETGDSFIVRNYPKKLLQARPSDLKNIAFRVYSSPQQINKEVLEILQALNVKELFVGIESIDDRILSTAQKGYNFKDVEHAIELLSRNKMPLHVPFIYGLPGETECSAEKTFEYAKNLVATYPVIAKVISGVAIPFQGTKLFRAIQSDPVIASAYQPFGSDYGGGCRKLKNDDILDYRKLVELNLGYFTKISYRLAVKMAEDTRALVPVGHSSLFGINWGDRRNK